MMKGQNPRNGIVGLGSVGRAPEHICEFYHQNVVGYALERNHDWARKLHCDMVFICVQTSEDSNERLDCSAVDNVLERLNRGRFRGITAIKSTLRIGFVDQIQLRYPTLGLAYCPECARTVEKVNKQTKKEKHSIKSSFLEPFPKQEARLDSRSSDRKMNCQR